MKRIFNYMMLSVWILVSVCCSDEELGSSQPLGKSGDEVKFGLLLPEGASRTVYGPEEVVKDDKGNVISSSFPIYWSDGDKVQIYSPQCLEGRNNAEYLVKPVANQNYAESLTKTGAYGVQWGKNETAKFYSVYPSANSSLQTVNGTVTATLNIAPIQTANYILKDGVYYVTDMNNVIMYAQTTGDVKSGEVVNLQYNPFSTVLEFEVESSGTGTALVDSIQIDATTNITGDFTLTFNESAAPSVAVAGNNGAKILLKFAVKPELGGDHKKMRVKACLMPISGVKNIDGWKITVFYKENNVSANKVKTLSGTSSLAAGKIHKLKLPYLNVEKIWTPTLSAWIPELPNYQQIYLTELSIPGAWYAGAPTSDGYQSTDNIETLWDNGIRAFAVETKMVGGSAISANKTPDNVVVSGTGNNSDKDFESGTNSLHSTAGPNGKVYKPKSTIGSWVGAGSTIYLQDIFEDVITQVKENPNEFAVLVLSYADGGDSGRRYIDYGAWLDEIFDAYNGLNETNYKKYVYGYEDNETITANTTIGDVKGHLIIKINVDANIAMKGYMGSTTFEYKNNLPALFSYTPFVVQLDSKYNSTPLYSKMHWMKWSDSTTDYRAFTTTTTNDFVWCFSSANRTHVDGEGTFEIPTYKERKAALGAMMTSSKKIYDSSDHNVWFYFNVGGTQAEQAEKGSTDAGAFATEMNKWLLDVINLKTNGGTAANGNLVYSDPSSLGIVMFNQCTNGTYKGPDIVNAIIMMNNKFELKIKSPNAKSAYQGASLDNGGNAVTPN